MVNPRSLANVGVDSTTQCAIMNVSRQRIRRWLPTAASVDGKLKNDKSLFWVATSCSKRSWCHTSSVYASAACREKMPAIVFRILYSSVSHMSEFKTQARPRWVRFYIFWIFSGMGCVGCAKADQTLLARGTRKRYSSKWRKGVPPRRRHVTEHCHCMFQCLFMLQTKMKAYKA